MDRLTIVRRAIWMLGLTAGDDNQKVFWHGFRFPCPPCP